MSSSTRCLLARGVLINFYFVRVNSVRDEHLVASAGVKSDGAAAIDDVECAAAERYRGWLPCAFQRRGPAEAQSKAAAARGSARQARVAVG